MWIGVRAGTRAGIVGRADVSMLVPGEVEAASSSSRARSDKNDMLGQVSRSMRLF